MTKQFLEQHPEEVKTKNPKYFHTHGDEGYHHSPFAFQVAEFLGWKEKTVYFSLERLKFSSMEKQTQAQISLRQSLL